MKFDLMKAIGVASKLGSTKEVMGFALNMLAKKNPNMASKLSQMIKSGDDPVKAIEQFAKDGSIKIEDLSKIKNIYTMAKKAGFKKFDVPKSVWDKAEQSLRAKTDNKNKWF